MHKSSCSVVVSKNASSLKSWEYHFEQQSFIVGTDSPRFHFSFTYLFAQQVTHV